MRTSTAVLFPSAIACVLLVPNAVAQDQAGGSPTTEFEDPQKRAIFVVDDFEDGNLDGWLFGGGPCSAAATNTTSGEGSWSMEVSGDCGHFGGPYFAFGSFQATGISVMLRPGSASFYDTYFVVGDDNILGDNGIVFFYATGLGRWSIVGPYGQSFDCGPYTAGQWYDVSFDLDWQWRTIAVRIDGSLCAVNVPFRSLTATTLTQIHAYNAETSTAWYDYIVMSSPPPSPTIFADGFESADAASWSLSVPELPRVVYLFDSGGTSGAIGGRSGADILCYQAAGSSGLPDDTTNRAFISVNANDEIRDLPSNYGVPTDRRIVGPTGIKIADSWADLLDGTIDTSLEDAEVTVASFWYSGSNADGSLAAEHCSGWTEGSFPDQGWYGRPIQTDSWWISRGSAACGSSAYTVLCVAWR